MMTAFEELELGWVLVIGLHPLTQRIALLVVCTGSNVATAGIINKMKHMRVYLSDQLSFHRHPSILQYPIVILTKKN
jgi:hypothetical protein